MQSTARDRRTGQFKQIAPRIPPAKKTIAEIHRESGVIAENIRMLMGRYNDSADTLADFVGINGRTVRNRLHEPWTFRLEELEAVAMRYDVTIRQLMSPIRFDED